jgi:hypothetical protein
MGILGVAAGFKKKDPITGERQIRRHWPPSGS